MNPLSEQDELLKKYLSGILKYRETYEEVYDHVLNSLCAMDSDELSFQQNIDLIITNDFGGSKGLKIIEESHQKAFYAATMKKQWRLFKNWFRYPLFPFTAALFGVTYLLGTKMPVIMNLVMIIVVVLTPILLTNIRYFKTGFIFGNTKRSIKDYPFRRIAFLPLNILYLQITCSALLYIFKDFLHLHLSGISALPASQLVGVEVSRLIYSLFFTGFTLNELCFYKLYKEEFKMSLTN
jgi:hypothetical protein